MKDLLRSHHILTPLCTSQCRCRRPCPRPCSFALRRTEKHPLSAEECLGIIEKNQRPRVGDRIRIEGVNGIFEFSRKGPTKPSKECEVCTNGTSEPRDKGGDWNTTPYWIFRVREEFINSHNGLWEEGAASGNTIALISALTALSKNPAREPQSPRPR